MRNELAWACAVFLVGASSVFAQQPQGQAAPANPIPVAESELANLFDAKIKTEWDAIKNKDGKALGALLTDDYVGVESDMEGERYKWKAQSELQESAVTDYTLSFLKVTPLGPEATFVRYEVFIKFPPKSLVKYEKLLVGEVWVKRDNQWKLLHHQETKVK